MTRVVQLLTVALAVAVVVKVVAWAVTPLLPLLAVLLVLVGFCTVVLDVRRNL